LAVKRQKKIHFSAEPFLLCRIIPVSKHFDGAIRRRVDDNKDASHTLNGAGGVLF
jgi:hypothetical protein